MKFVFVGEGDSDPEVFTIYGLEFKLNGPGVEVSDPAQAAKLAGNKHFREGETAEPVPMKRKPGRPPKAPRIEQVELPDED